MLKKSHQAGSKTATHSGSQSTDRAARRKKTKNRRRWNPELVSPAEILFFGLILVVFLSGGLFISTGGKLLIPLILSIMIVTFSTIMALAQFKWKFLRKKR